jgi:hypothetical protein
VGSAALRGRSVKSQSSKPVVIQQYPDSATYTLPATPVQDSEGNFTVPAGTAFTTSCRAEYNTRGATIGFVDGEAVKYDYAVYQPTHTTEIVPGTPVTITLHNGRIIDTTVKRHENNQLNSKSWV